MQQCTECVLYAKIYKLCFHNKILVTIISNNIQSGEQTFIQPHTIHLTSLPVCIPLNVFFFNFQIHILFMKSIKQIKYIDYRN